MRMEYELMTILLIKFTRNLLVLVNGRLVLVRLCLASCYSAILTYFVENSIQNA